MPQNDNDSRLHEFLRLSAEQRHPDASKFKPDLFPKFSTGDPASFAMDLVESSSPYWRYHQARQYALSFSTPRLLQKVKQYEGKETPKAIAYRDEAIERGALHGQSRSREVKTQPTSSFPVLGASFLGALATALPTMGVLGMDKGGPKLDSKAIGQKLLERAKKEGLDVFEHPDAHYHEGRIGVPTDIHQSVFAHELGHATGTTGKRLAGYTYGPSMIYARAVMPLVSVLAATRMGDMSLTKNDAEKETRLKKGKAIAALGALPYAPVLAEEARATARGAKYLVDYGGARELPAAALRLLPAYSTYAAGLAGPAAAYYILDRKLKKLQRKMKRNRPLSKAAMAAFLDEKEKIAASEKAERTAKALAGAGAGVAAGYVGTRYAYPAILRALGKSGKLSPAVKAILTAAAGATGAALVDRIGAYRNEPSHEPARELPAAGAVQPKDRELAQRHEGHSSEVPAGPVLPDAPWTGELPLRADWHGRRHGRAEHGDRDLGRRKREYEYGGKETRDYRFPRSLRMG